MRSLKSYFSPPHYARSPTNSTPKKSAIESEEARVSSSPLSDPPPSSIATTSTPVPDTPGGPGAQLNASLSKSLHEGSTIPPTREESFLSIGSTTTSSITDNTSQRIVKGGKEIVISSDGEDTDSLGDDLDDPSTLFAPISKKSSKHEPIVKKPNRADKAYLAKLTAPKQYKNSLASLVHDALDDNEIEAKVAQVKASFQKTDSKSAASRHTKDKPVLSEDLLKSALGDAKDDQHEDPKMQRVVDAARRTEALEKEPTFWFFDKGSAKPANQVFPMDAFPPGSSLSAIREPESRARMIQSGILEFASSLGRLPDEFILWAFKSIPVEPREELRKAYCRIFVNTPAECIQSQIHPEDIDYLFLQLGARTQALDLTTNVVAEEPDDDRKIDQRASLVSVLGLLQDASDLFSVEVRAHAVHILLRISLDDLVTKDYTIHSRLQSALAALLENVTEAEIDDMEHRLGTTIYDTVKPPKLQSRMIQHILPTSPWISLLRYRLSVSFLLQNPTPLTEPIEEVLDFSRLAEIIHDPRFQISIKSGQEAEIDYGDLLALVQLLEVVINSTLYDLSDKRLDTEKEFIAAIDQLAAHLKANFSSMKGSGASHMKRMLSKGALELVYCRLLYSVRPKLPPKRTIFETYSHDGNDINTYFNRKVVKENGMGTNVGDITQMPIRGHDHME